MANDSLDFNKCSVECPGSVLDGSKIEVVLSKPVDRDNYHYIKSAKTATQVTYVDKHLVALFRYHHHHHHHHHHGITTTTTTTTIIIITTTIITTIMASSPPPPPPPSSSSSSSSPPPPPPPHHHHHHHYHHLQRFAAFSWSCAI